MKWVSTSAPTLRPTSALACVGCGMCAHVCPRRVLKLEVKADRFKSGTPTPVFALDL